MGAIGRLAAAATAWALAAPPAGAAVVCASDVDGDADVDVVDVQCVVLAVVAELAAAPAPACLAWGANGDVNCDGVVDVVDAQALIGGALGTAPAYGACAQGATCDDGNPCTWDDCGSAGVCRHGQVDCDDGDPCTVDTCGLSGCVHTPVTCGAGLACQGGVCAPTRRVGMWYSVWYASKGPLVRAEDDADVGAALFVADVDGDGNDDVVTWVEATGTWRVRRGGAGGELAPVAVWQIGLGVGADGAWVRDVTGDGRADVVVFYEPQGVWFVAPSLGGAFGAPASWIAGHGVGAQWWGVADVDGDGRDDAVVAFSDPTSGLAGHWYVARSTGAAFDTYGSWATGHGVGADWHALADVDGDGMADALAGFSGAGAVYVALSTGAAFANYSAWAPAGVTGLPHVMPADLTGDGRADLVGTRTGMGEAVVAWVSTGTALGVASPWTLNHMPFGLSDTMAHRAARMGGARYDVGLWSERGRISLLPAPEWAGTAAGAPADAAAWNTWDAWDARWRPVLGDYDSLDEGVIDAQLDMLEAAGVDFLVVDLTNGWQPYIVAGADALFARIEATQRPIDVAVAVGTDQFCDPPCPQAVEDDAASVWSHFVAAHPDHYFHRDGKPVLVVYANAPQRAAWQGWGGDKSASAKFSLRWVQGTVSSDDPVPGHNFWGWGVYGQPPGPERVVLPGWDNRRGAAPIPRQGGATYAARWQAVLDQVPPPQLVIVNSFNEHIEQTGVEPAMSLDGDPAAPDGYWQMTIDFVAQFKGL